MNFIRILKRLEAYSISLPYVNEVNLGDIYEFLNGNPNVKYASVNIDINNSVRNDNLISYSVYLYYIDRLTEDKSNWMEVKTTAEQTLNSIINYAAKIGDVNDGWTINYFEQQFADYCAGGYVQFNLEVPNEMGDCEMEGFDPEYPGLTLTITENGVYNVEEYARAVVDVPQGSNYTAGDGIEISEENVISANTEATLKTEITLSNGAPIDAMGIWVNNVIPEGTSIQNILEKLLNRELFPSAATKPSFTVSDNNVGNREYLSTYEPTAPTATKNNGNYNASYSTPAQPDVTGVTWSNETVSSEIISGFTGSGASKTIQIGTNKITYTYSKDYSAPSNMPVSNQNHPTQSTSKISTDGSDISAIWAAGTETKIADVIVTGCYVCFNNISNSTLSNNAETKCSLTAGNEITLTNVPSENVANKHFKFAFPADRTAQFKIRDLSGVFVDYSATYTTETVNNFYNGIAYKVITTTGDFQGVNTYKFIFNKNLNA